MWMMALAAIVCGVAWLLIDRRSAGHGAPAIRLGVATFGFFGLITAALWMIMPGGVSRTVTASGGDTLTLQIVQARGAIILPFGLLALYAMRVWPDRSVRALVGPALYNCLMAVEALRAQFTSLATPERWLYVALHFLWAVTLVGYTLTIDWRTVRLRASVAALLSDAIALAATATGLLLYVAPQLLISGDIVQDPLRFHSAHAFGASLAGYGAAFLSLGFDEPTDRAQVFLVGLAALLLSAIALLAGSWALSGAALFAAGSLAAAWRRT